MVHWEIGVGDRWYGIHGEGARREAAQIMLRGQEHLPPHATQKRAGRLRQTQGSPQCTGE